MTKSAISASGTFLAILVTVGCNRGPTIEIVQASYGASCNVSPGNATRDVADSCNGKESCQYVVDVTRLGDPKVGCAKDFSVEYRCGPDQPSRQVRLPAEAGLGSVASLACP